MELPQIDPVHPGEILHDFITDNGTSVEAVAAATGISSKLLHGAHDITPEVADRLGSHFGTTPNLWTNLQHQYDEDRKG